MVALQFDSDSRVRRTLGGTPFSRWFSTTGNLENPKRSFELSGDGYVQIIVEKLSCQEAGVPPESNEITLAKDFEKTQNIFGLRVSRNSARDVLKEIGKIAPNLRSEFRAEETTRGYAKLTSR